MERIKMMKRLAEEKGLGQIVKVGDDGNNYIEFENGDIYDDSERFEVLVNGKSEDYVYRGSEDLGRFLRTA